MVLNHQDFLVYLNVTVNSRSSCDLTVDDTLLINQIDVYRFYITCRTMFEYYYYIIRVVETV